MSTIGRSDLRDARCTECGARCVPGQSHAQHNAGWLKKLLMWDWHEVSLDGYPGWDLVDPGGGHDKHPPCVKLAIRNKVDKSMPIGLLRLKCWRRDSNPSRANFEFAASPMGYASASYVGVADEVERATVRS